MEDRIFIHHNTDMKKSDPFIEGIRRIFDARADLKPAKVSVDAGLDNSTIRKLLSGTNASPKVETASRIANAMGYSLATIISIGAHDTSPEIVNLLDRIGLLPEKERIELDAFIQYLHSKVQ